VSKAKSKAEAPRKTTTVDLVIRLQVKGSPAEVAKYRAALQALAEIMVVQAENGLWSLGYEDAEFDDIPNKYVADIEHTGVHTILIDGSDAAKGDL
jgi:hypothetical protein